MRQRVKASVTRYTHEKCGATDGACAQLCLKIGGEQPDGLRGAAGHLRYPCARTSVPATTIFEF